VDAGNADGADGTGGDTDTDGPNTESGIGSVSFWNVAKAFVTHRQAWLISHIRSHFY